MGRSVPGDQQPAGQADIYWRRRVAALALGIAILALLAWTVNGAMGGGKAARPTAAVTDLPGQAAHPAGSPGAPSPTAASTGTAAPAASASASASASPKRAPTPTAAATRTRRPARPDKATTTAQGVRPCPAGDVVISLFAAQYSYGPHDVPQFEVDVVSTAPRLCTFNLGVKNVRLLIRSGSARVWGSADCARGAGPQVTKLAKGVPAVLRISWDRKTSVPGCRLPGRVAQPGTYTATAYSGQFRTQTMIFVLRGPGVAEP
jgi:hypothetical protein